ncbi:MAG TPA: prepilin-type N-terminal cleavage/methylation domain-containing protein [Longimicrobiales bacterium]|nr:prepilin-type N-terminal cleavage/methylation domain-containing protein [Longimicrobiales bacterium]
MRGRRGGRGFTLLEVAVAVIVLAVGMTGVAGLVTLAVRSFAEARSLEATLRAAEVVVDSLAWRGVEGDGTRLDPVARIAWTVGPDTAGHLVRLRADPEAGRIGVELTAILSRRAPP